VLAEFERPGLAWLKPWLDRHDTFSFTRNPFARGVAFGLFCGLIPGPLQIIAAAALCVLFRGNVIASVVATFYTNPLTIIPLYVAAFHIGDAVLPGVYDLPKWSGGAGGNGFFTALSEWIHAMGWPLVVGLPALAIAIAGVGYALTQIVWLLPVLRRAKRMRDRAQSSV
jgi:uncharacterized protein